MKIKIYVSCHKDCYTLKHPLIFPIHVGAALAKERLPGMLRDDSGENISKKNRKYCELTALYWAWKNDADSDYLGFWHYRRFMSFAKKPLPRNSFEDIEIPFLDQDSAKTLCIDPDEMQKTIERYDIITTIPVKLKKMGRGIASVRRQYELSPHQHKEDLDTAVAIIKEKFPEYYKTAMWYLDKSPLGYYCNMFIMKRKLFERYCQWLFAILEEHERRRGCENYTAQGMRVSGHLAERLFAIWYLKLKKSGKFKTCELPRALFQNVQKDEPVFPAFKSNNVAVAFAADNAAAPCLGAAMASVIKNASEQNNYDILVLTKDISAVNKERLARVAEGRKNVSVRFVNPQRKTAAFCGAGLDFCRLALAELFENYKKILWLDSDTIAKTDVAELYLQDVSGFLLAACRDIVAADVCLDSGFGQQPRFCGLNKSFEAGVALLNLEEFRKSFSAKDMAALAAKENLPPQGKAVLNAVCQGRVKFLDMAWNVMAQGQAAAARAPEWLETEYKAARREPKIIHYSGGQKPWQFAEMEFANDFWECAKQTPFYEILLGRMASLRFDQELQKHIFDAHVKKGVSKLAQGLARCVKENGIRYTAKRVVKKTFGE